MNRTIHGYSALSLFVALPFAIACGGNAVAGSSGGHTGTGGNAGLCALDPPGSTFTFHVHNGGTAMLRLAYGCGASLPIVLAAPQGMLGIGPGPADACEFTCDAVYAGKTGQSCSDCGPGTGASLAPGAVVDITWDRRVYTEHMVDPT